jgi:hypothetical protein
VSGRARPAPEPGRGQPSPPGERPAVRARGAAAAIAVGGAALGLLLLGATPVAASPCVSGYVAQLRQAASELGSGAPPQGVATQLGALAAADGAAPALAPVIADLESGQVGDAQARLLATATALQPPGAGGCASPSTGATRRALSGVYASPAFANLDQPSSPSWAQRLIDAISSFLQRLEGALGPAATIALVAILLGALIGLAAWRFRQVMGAGREATIRPEGEPPPPIDPDAEWARAEAAAREGDFREAVRRAFRSVLLSLSLRGRLAVQSAWTTPELLAHAGGDAELAGRLAPAAAAFDRAWYSSAPVGPEDWEGARERCAALRALPGEATPRARR